MKQEMVLPKNIRQIGEIPQDRKVYLEDYVMTYIRKKEKEGVREGAGILMGRRECEEEISYFFFKGAVLLEENGEEECWEKLEEAKKNYFSDMEMLGCFLFGTMEEERMQEIQEHLAGMPMIIFHMQEGEERVYWTEGKQYHHLKGYFVFYERNPQMQKYMTEMETPQSVEAEEGGSDKAIISFRKKITEKNRGRRAGGRHYLASSFFVLTILLLGVTIVNNYDRMKRMEKWMKQIEQEQQLQKIVSVMSAEAETEKKVTAAEEASAEGTSEEKETGETEEELTILQETLAQIEEEKEHDLGAVQEESEIAGTEFSAEETVSVAQQSLAERNYSAEDVSWTEDTMGRADEVLASAQRQNQAVYTIRYGDTLADISQKYYGTLEKVQEICILNEIDDANMIVPGQKIVLP